MKELGITKGEWKIRLFPEGDDFFVEAPNLNKPELGYGIEIMQDDFGTHNGYPREQRLADAVLIADAGNTAQKCGLLPSELLRQRDELKEALDRIADPIAYMERNLKEGERLDGMMAIHIANNPEYLKKIAEAAIKNTEK